MEKSNLRTSVWRKKIQEQNFRIENLKLNLGDKDFKNNFCRTKSLEAKNLWANIGNKSFEKNWRIKIMIKFGDKLLRTK